MKTFNKITYVFIAFCVAYASLVYAAPFDYTNDDSAVTETANSTAVKRILARGSESQIVFTDGTSIPATESRANVKAAIVAAEASVSHYTASISADTTLTSAQLDTGKALISVDSSGGAVAITLPESTDSIPQGAQVTVLVTTGGNDVTAAKTGSDTIQALTVSGGADAANDYFIYELIGTRWIIVQEFAS